MFARQPFVLCQVVRFDGEIGPVHRLRTGRRAKKVYEGPGFLLSGKSAQAIFRHGRGGMPEGQFDGASLVDAQGAVPHLIPAG